MLSDRFVTQNGIMLMGGAALIMMLLTAGSVRFLVVLYSINVFITFVLSQLGMVRHWWSVRSTFLRWKKKMAVNAVGLLLTSFILISVTVLKFHEGGWITLLVTGTLIVVAILINRHYRYTGRLLRRLDSLMHVVSRSTTAPAPGLATYDAHGKTAILLVNGFNGLGCHTLLNVVSLFGTTFKNFVFVQVGVIDAGNFKGTAEIEHLQQSARSEVERYMNYVKQQGYYAESISAIGTDVVDEVEKVIPQIRERFPHAVFFGGQIVFPNESFLMRLLHNYTVFSLQRKLYTQGVPFVIMPVRI